MLLVSLEPSHHRLLPNPITSSPVNHGPRQTSTDFCNKIGPERQFAATQHQGRFWSKADIGAKQTLIEPRLQKRICHN
jgi:hypothetical protein